MISFLAVIEGSLWLGFPLAAFACDWNSCRTAASDEKQPAPSTDLLRFRDPDRRTDAPLSLAQLLDLANRHYPDGWLAEYFDPSTGERTVGSGDTLAQFIVVEISETFASEATAPEQLDEARRVLLRAIDDLHGVIRAFDAYEQRLR